MKLRTVRYLKAFALFEQKKYDESMDLFSFVSATPRIVISLFPPIIAGEWSQHEEPEDSEAKVTEQGENGTPAVASAIPEGLRANLGLIGRSPKETESDTSSILSKHTETSTSGPPGNPPTMPFNMIEGKDLIRATLALVRYLADMRFKLSRWLNEPVTKDTATPDIRILFSPSLEASDSQQENVPDLELEEAAELVDTTLFRAYMLCRPQLVGPLVRRPNRCVPSVVQEMLEHAHVYPLNSKLT
jgi:hypothetical protein